MLEEGSTCEHTASARFSYTLVLASVAVPQMKSPAPCCKPWHTRHVPAGRWMMRELKEGSTQAGTDPSLILVHVGVGQRCSAPSSDAEPPAILPTMSTRVTFQLGPG
jgi:hypothetical protein